MKRSLFIASLGMWFLLGDPRAAYGNNPLEPGHSRGGTEVEGFA